MAETYKYSGVVYATPAADQVDFALTTSDGNDIVYLSGDHIHAYTSDDGKAWAEVARGDAADQWNFKPSDPKTVRFGTAPGAAKQVRLLRITPYQTKYTTFQEGSLLTSSQLNDGEDFSMLVDQELYDETLKIREGGGGSTNVITTAQQLAGAPDWTAEDTKVPTAGAASSRLDVIVGDGAGYPGTGNVGQNGKLRVDNSVTPNKLFYWNTATAAWVEVKATSGTAATVDVGTTTTLAAGSPATVTNSGTTTAAIFDFGIPKGDKGDPGDGVEYKGPIDPTTTPPSGFNNGSFYVSTTAGAAIGAWTGITNVAVNDRLIFNGNTNQWDQYSQAWIQSDWAEADSGAAAFIENKPTLGTMAAQDDAAADGKQYGRQNGAWTEIATAGGTNIGYTAAANQGTITSSTGTDATVPLADNVNAGLFTAAEKTKLGGLEQSDWNANSGGAEILNKPTIPAAQVNSDWNATNGVAEILNKPAIPAAQVNSDWNANSGVAEILNKPSLDFVPLAGGNMTGTLSQTLRAITAGSFDLSTGNVWTCGGINVPNPTNAVAGTSGLIVFTGIPTGWGSNFEFPGGTAPTIATMLAVVPFFVIDSGTILLGNATEAIS